MQKCLIPIRLGNCKVRALLDSGSTISAINGNLFQKSEFASLPLKTPKVLHIIGAGGATHPIQGQIDLQFSIGGLLLSQTFYVIPAFRQSMILGTDFLQKNEACLDWQNNTLSLRQNTVNVNIIHMSQGFARVSKTTDIPPNSIQNIKIRLSKTKSNETVLLEPNLKTTKYSFVAAKCLIKNKPESLFIQVLNPTDDIIKVHSGYVIVSIDKIDYNDIIDMSNKNLKDQSNNKQQNRQKSDIKFDLDNSDLNEEQKEILTQFLNQNRNVFATNLQELGKTNLYKHTIDTGDSKPIKCRPYRTSPAAKQEIQKQIDEMLKNDIIEHSTSEYSFPIVLVKKKNGEFRFAIDYRKLNAVTQPITYPLPRLDDVFDAIGQTMLPFTPN